MRIAIIGAGISGLTTLYRLNRLHDVSLFEANDYPGGHTHTVDVELHGSRYAIDTGFIVFNDRTYPNFVRLLDELHVRSQPTEMSFSVRCDDTGLEYNGSSLPGLFAQPQNLFRPAFYRMLRDILRFNREALKLLEDDAAEITVEDFLQQRAYSREFAEQYLLPMGSAIWSCPVQAFARFPARFIAEFFHNHGLLTLTNRPQWRVVCGGSRTYVDALLSGLRDRIRLHTPIAAVRRHADGVEIVPAGAAAERFDHVVFACHSDQALRLLVDPTPVEREVLGAFPYSRNVALLHTDTSLLPKRRRAWAAWNYHVCSADLGRATVTYNMNILQRLSSPEVFCVSLNGEDQVDPQRVVRRFVYEHPVYTSTKKAAQQRHAELLDANHTSYCGAYWGNGFHEDGVNSALAVCRALARKGAPCIAPSTWEVSGIVDTRPCGTTSSIGCT